MLSKFALKTLKFIGIFLSLSQRVGTSIRIYCCTCAKLNGNHSINRGSRLKSKASIELFFYPLIDTVAEFVSRSKDLARFSPFGRAYKAFVLHQV